jgi:hypothetical protein
LQVYLNEDAPKILKVCEPKAPLLARVPDMGELLYSCGVKLEFDGPGTTYRACVTSIGKIPDSMGLGTSPIFALINTAGYDPTMAITLGSVNVALSTTIEITYRKGPDEQDTRFHIFPGDIIAYGNGVAVGDHMLVLGAVHALNVDGSIHSKATKILGVRLASFGRKNQPNEIRIVGPTGKGAYNFKSEPFKLVCTSLSSTARDLFILSLEDYFEPWRLTRMEALALLLGDGIIPQIDKALLNAFPMFDCYRELLPACGFFERMMQQADEGRPIIPPKLHAAFLLKMAAVGNAKQVSKAYATLGELTSGMRAKAAAECADKGRFFADVLNGLPYLGIDAGSEAEILATHVPTLQQNARAEKGSGNHIADSRATAAGGDKRERPPPAQGTRGAALAAAPASKKGKAAEKVERKRKAQVAAVVDESSDYESDWVSDDGAGVLDPKAEAAKKKAKKAKTTEPNPKPASKYARDSNPKPTDLSHRPPTLH